MGRPVLPPIVALVPDVIVPVAMNISLKSNAASGDRLVALQHGDNFRQWQTPADERFCILCEEKIRGHKILIERDEQGSTHLHCPTRGCQGTPREWVYPGNPLTSESVYQDWWRALNRETDQPPPALFEANMGVQHA